MRLIKKGVLNKIMIDDVNIVIIFVIFVDAVASFIVGNICDLVLSFVDFVIPFIEFVVSLVVPSSCDLILSFVLVNINILVLVAILVLTNVCIVNSYNSVVC
jgi:hypothetical protein